MSLETFLAQPISDGTNATFCGRAFHSRELSSDL